MRIDMKACGKYQVRELSLFFCRISMGLASVGGKAENLRK